MSKFIFDDDYSTEIVIQEQNGSIILYLSDELSIVDKIDDMPSDYEDRILSFLERSSKWYFKAINNIKPEIGTNVDVKLMSIYVLTEPNEEPLKLGLLYRVSSDIEHGRGMKINANTMEIIEYGLADVAFS